MILFDLLDCFRRWLIFTVAATVLAAVRAEAQDAEPRQYSNTPIGLNFLIAGYIYAQGKLAFDPQLPIADAQFHSNTGALAYVRSFDFLGYSAKFDVIVPYSEFSARAHAQGLQRERDMTGFGDPRFRVSVNLLGAPALSLKEFASYKQDLIVGVSLQVSAPLGQYDDTKLLNLGNNRWSFTPELGISKAWGRWTFEVAPSVTFFTVNPDFFDGRRFEQAPLYLLRTSLIHNFDSGAWISLDGIYFKGLRTTVNGNRGDNEQENARAGFTIGLPIDRQNSIKLNAGTGIYTRTGSQFSNVAIAWQYRWGAGY
ncbi:transporter [Bradyrhizobium manausense]|uniref:transporter n=1 Tax=Bradyrhizobium TaxID=374 RepID=UPI001BA5CB33|nr:MULTISPECIES: transporter [Bradyrhizobium]MBR0830736.1 transporter [Bradyrhizobium manausense]UVO28724.1 transporter [Bradyrhizobium arachidis]